MTLYLFSNHGAVYVKLVRALLLPGQKMSIGVFVEAVLRWRFSFRSQSCAIPPDRGAARFLCDTGSFDRGGRDAGTGGKQELPVAQ